MTVKVAVEVLSQLKGVIAQIGFEEYKAPLKVFNGASLGKHARHTIEFFQCLMKSTVGGTVNYDARIRSVQLEEDVNYSVEVIETLTHYLSTNNFDNIGISLVSDFGCDEHVAVPTNFNRELIYLIEHSLHHFALIRIGIQQNFPHVQLPDGFGVAHSTIKHQHEIYKK